MTTDENVAIERLRDELHEYHVDVQRLIQRCESCRGDVECLLADVYGLPGNKKRSPGLLGEVAELRGSRRRMLLAMRGAWLLLTAMAGALATAIVKTWI
ncbi:MAG: hypothetical protein KKA28_12750 [Planctomycetes bacterium]|nr:hypothetical protein [Planctomycetota bacterium]MCG2685520.1 hypothetical protein [Planctomycetales bacterium]